MEDSWYDVTWKNDGSSLMTDDETQTLVHEIGHIAGLDHPNGNGYESGCDQTISVMSYFEGFLCQLQIPNWILKRFR